MTAIDNITINRTGMGKTGEIYLANKYGLAITPLRFKKDTFLKQRIDTINVRKCLTRKTKQHAAEEKRISVFTNYRGLRVLGTHEPIFQTQWCLLAEITEKEALAPLTKIKILFFILMIFIPIAGYLIGFFISRAITGPIHRLREGAEIIGKGNLAYKINVKSKDEIGRLAMAFDKMTEDLKKTTTSMDNLNKEIVVRKKVEDERDVLIGELEENQIKLKRQNREMTDSRMAIKNVANDLAKSKEEVEEKRNSLEKINEELNDFTYTVSHDLKEPLRSISAFSKFINDDYRDCLDEEGKNYLERIRVNVNNLQNLIEDLLDISRIERMNISFEEIQTEKIVNEVKLRLEYLIQQKNAEIFIKNKLPKVFCDRVRLTQVFLNLVSNAVKFNDKPEPRVEIGSGKRGNFYEFYVKDNGQGIEERYFGKIFEIFQRLCRKEEYEGTGAGLTIVKKVVQMYGGRVWVESKVGEGTAFYFTIPAAKEFIIGRKKIGEILVKKKLVTEEDVKRALKEQS